MPLPQVAFPSRALRFHGKSIVSVPPSFRAALSDGHRVHGAGTILIGERYLGKSFPDSARPPICSDGGRKRPASVGRDLRAWRTVPDPGRGRAYIFDTAERKASPERALRVPGGDQGPTTQMDECNVVEPRNRLADFILYTQGSRHRLGVAFRVSARGDGNLTLLCRDLFASRSGISS